MPLENVDYAHVVNAFYASAWAILPEKLLEIRAFINLKARGVAIEYEPPQARAGAGGADIVGRVAVLPVFGVISQRVGMLSAMSGGTSTEAIGRAFDSLISDKAVKAVVLNVDSPGGSVYGVDELARKIYQARGEKKIVAVANSLAASAAYYIASAASEINVTPGGEVGSIGVFSAHEDLSKLEEMAGVKTTLVAAGKYKVEGNPYEPLSGEARDTMQAQVDRYYGLFVDAVARHRGVSSAAVRGGFGQGRVVGAREAVSLGMADKVATLEQVLARLGVPEGSTPAGAAASTQPADLALMDMRQRLAEAE